MIVTRPQLNPKKYSLEFREQQLVDRLDALKDQAITAENRRAVTKRIQDVEKELVKIRWQIKSREGD
jgi:hypothetical protein